MKFLKQLGKCICYVALYFGMQFVVSAVAVIGYSAYLGFMIGLQGISPDQINQDALAIQVAEGLNSMLSILMVIAGVVTILILWAFFAIRKKKFTKEVGLVKFHASYWPMILIGSVGLCLLVNFGMQLIPIPEDVLMEYAEASESLMEGPFVLLLLANAIMAPLVEEILFRGLVLSRLQKAMPVWGALILSSVIFGMMHGQILWICYTSLVGLVLGAVALKTGSTWAPMFMHFAFNLFGTCLGYFVESVTGMTSMALTVAGALCLAVCLGLLLNTDYQKELAKE